MLVSQQSQFQVACLGRSQPEIVISFKIGRINLSGLAIGGDSIGRSVRLLGVGTLGERPLGSRSVARYGRRNGMVTIMKLVGLSCRKGRVILVIRSRFGCEFLSYRQ